MTTDFLTDLISQPRICALVARRTGPVIAQVQALSAKKDSYVSSLYELGESPHRLTTSVKGESLLAIGEEGELYFTSERPDEEAEEGEKTLWMLPRRGEARVILRRMGAISSLTCAGGKLFLIADVLAGAAGEEDEAKIRAERSELGVSAILYEDFPTRYWDKDLGPGAPALLSMPAGYDAELTRWELPEGRLVDISVSEDGQIVLATVQNRVGMDRFTSVYRLREEGKPEPLVLSEALTGEGLTSYEAGPISPDGQRVALLVGTGNRDGDPLRCWMEICDLSGERRRPAPDFTDWPGDITWIDDSTIAFTAARRGRQSVYRLDLEADEITLVTDDDYAYSNLLAHADGIYALRTSILRAPAPVLLKDGEVIELANPAGDFAAPGRLTEVEATAEDGTALRSWLVLPEEVPDEGAPLVVFAHGGPWGSWNSWTWRWNPGPFADRGYAILLPDPAISTGYGQQMIDRGNDQLGGTPFTDIMALTDAAVARDDINAERTAFAGGSYGGYMANWVAGHTGKRFRAIVTHASLWNLDMMGRTTDNGSWHEWTNPTQEADFSPHRFAEQIEVPMLVIHGDRDYRVPISQGQALWHALLRDAKVGGHKFLYFPDEGHWILKPQNAKVWYDTFLAFLDQHVFCSTFDRPRLLG